MHTVPGAAINLFENSLVGGFQSEARGQYSHRGDEMDEEMMMMNDTGFVQLGNSMRLG